MTNWIDIPADTRDLIEHTAYEAGIDLDGVETVKDVLARLGDVADHRVSGDGAESPTIRERLAGN